MRARLTAGAFAGAAAVLAVAWLIGSDYLADERSRRDAPVTEASSAATNPTARDATPAAAVAPVTSAVPVGSAAWVAPEASAARAPAAASSGSAGSARAAASAAASGAAAGLASSDPCEDMVKRLPNMTDALCRMARLAASGARSVNGYPLYQRDITAAPAQPPATGSQAPNRPRVLVIGAMHGDELSSASLVFHWIAHAMETGADMDWRFIPALNPDGLLQKRPTRTNSRGIDLNRNFPTPNWEHEAIEYWNKRTKQDARRYPGPHALSEPESRFVQDTINGWKPDVIVSIHAPYGVLDYDGPSTPPARLGRLFLDRVGIYPGSLGNYGGVHRGVPVVTIELPSAIRTPTDAEMRQMWIDLLRWIGERLTPPQK